MNAINQRSGWWRSIGREWRHQRLEHPRSVRTVVVVWLVLSGSLAGLLWQQRWLLLQQRQARQGQTDQGLLQLRVNSHKITALDWGHWYPVYAYAVGNDPCFEARELNNSSILQDGQGLLLVNKRSKALLARGDAIADGMTPQLLQCLQGYLQRLKARPGAVDSGLAYGFHCQAGERSVLGAATGIRRSDSGGDPRGWLMHFSRIERPSYNTEVNAAFRRINASLRNQPSREATPANSLNELLPSEEKLYLQPPRSPWQQGWLALEEMAPPWLGINGLVGVIGVGGLLSLREVRRRELHVERNRRYQLRVLRQELPGPLLSRSELLQAMRQPGEDSSELWIAALQLKVLLFRDSIHHHGQAQNLALAWLGERLQQLEHTRHLALGDSNTLLQVLKPSSAEAHEEHRQLEQHLSDLQQAMAEAMQLAVGGIFTRLDTADVAQQLADLALLLSHGDAPSGVQRIAEGVAPTARKLRQQQSRDFDLTRSMKSLQDHRYALEPVLKLASGQRHVAYSEMLFRLPAELEDSISVQELVLSLERNNNVYLLDQLMLRQAITLLQEDGDETQQLGVNISALSIGSDAHITNLLAQLRAMPETVRRRLVLEVTETALVAKPEMMERQLQQLRDFGIRIAIDDFGMGYASIGYLFQLQPDFLKLDLSYSQRINDANVDALVDFLVRYGDLNDCGVILEGIETEAQLHYWQTRGVALFQGYLFKQPSSA